MGALEPIIIYAQVLQHELLLFTAFWFLLGALDDLGIDMIWMWLRLSGRGRSGRISKSEEQAPLQGYAAVFIASWKEAAVIGHTVTHALSVWKQDNFVLYLGCYCNDPDTIAAVIEAAGNDLRVRLVIHDRPGPTSKADCLNRIYTALEADERKFGRTYRSVILHDSEDMVHPAELAVIDANLSHAEFIQIPVRPEPQPNSPWVAGHYTDEFTESHSKSMVVRDALQAPIPAAGVGCGFSREMLAQIALAKGDGRGPFSPECLTEDYELGHLVSTAGGRSRFLRLRDESGELVATRAYFPATVETSVRQKSRWIHGIAFQGWDRLGWEREGIRLWMALHDRRGPLTVIVLACAYLLMLVEGGLLVSRWAFGEVHVPPSPILQTAMQLCFVVLLWRCLFRFLFTMREYGVSEGIMAVLRIPVANYISILAGRRALMGYIGGLRGFGVHWEKTEHDAHPAMLNSVAGGA